MMTCSHSRSCRSISCRPPPSGSLQVATSKSTPICIYPYPYAHMSYMHSLINYDVACHVAASHVAACHVAACHVAACHAAACHVAASHVAASHFLHLIYLRHHSCHDLRHWTRHGLVMVLSWSRKAFHDSSRVVACRGLKRECCFKSVGARVLILSRLVHDWCV